MIRYILTNEKYVGDALLQKSYVTDVISRKVVANKGKLAKYLVKNAHPAIISRDVFEAVQVEIDRRKHIRRVTS